MSGPCAGYPLTPRWTNLHLSDQQNSCRLALFPCLRLPAFVHCRSEENGSARNLFPRGVLVHRGGCLPHGTRPTSLRNDRFPLQDAPSRYSLGCVARRSALPRERFSPLALLEIFLPCKTRALAGHADIEQTLIPFNLAEATDWFALPYGEPCRAGQRQVEAASREAGARDAGQPLPDGAGPAHGDKRQSRILGRSPPLPPPLVKVLRS